MKELELRDKLKVVLVKKLESAQTKEIVERH